VPADDRCADDESSVDERCVEDERCVDDEPCVGAALAVPFARRSSPGSLRRSRSVRPPWSSTVAEPAPVVDVALELLPELDREPAVERELLPELELELDVGPGAETEVDVPVTEVRSSAPREAEAAPATVPVRTTVARPARTRTLRFRGVRTVVPFESVVRRVATNLSPVRAGLPVIVPRL
jgi:hypothetical protein